MWGSFFKKKKLLGAEKKTLFSFFDDDPIGSECTSPSIRNGPSNECAPRSAAAAECGACGAAASRQHEPPGPPGGRARQGQVHDHGEGEGAHVPHDGLEHSRQGAPPHQTKTVHALHHVATVFAANAKGTKGTGRRKINFASNCGIASSLVVCLYFIFPSFYVRCSQYPEITCARLKLGPHSFQTTNFSETRWEQFATVIVNYPTRQTVGKLQVRFITSKRLFILLTQIISGVLP